MLGQHRRRWANINPALVQRLEFTVTLPLLLRAACFEGLKNTKLYSLLR